MVHFYELNKIAFFVVVCHRERYIIALITGSLLIFFPVLAAVFVPILFKKLKSIHTGWFVLIVPVVLLIYYTSFIQTTMSGETAISSLPWIPSLGISFVSYIDGLSLLFTLLITG